MPSNANNAYATASCDEKNKPLEWTRNTAIPWGCRHALKVRTQSNTDIIEYRTSTRKPTSPQVRTKSSNDIMCNNQHNYNEFAQSVLNSFRALVEYNDTSLQLAQQCLMAASSQTLVPQALKLLMARKTAYNPIAARMMSVRSLRPSTNKFSKDLAKVTFSFVL